MMLQPKIYELKGGTGNSQIIVGRAFDDLDRLIPSSNVIIITDERVNELYASRFPSFPVITIGRGEGIKDLETVSAIYSRFMELGADRDTFILAIGGGLVSDVAGFAASTYLRGLRYGFVASTLLSQVDASVGGKNGVNYGGIKNIVGVFRQPEFVVCNLEMLGTLEEEEVLSGLGEVMKYGFIKDKEILSFFVEGVDISDTALMQRLVSSCVEIKKDIVEADELEAGERRLLNFGHSFGHAIESTTGVPHGIAVTWGMLAAIFISEGMGSLDKVEAESSRELIYSSGILRAVKLDSRRLKEHFASDKKRIGTSLNFVLLKEKGSSFTEKISMDRLNKWLDDWLGYESGRAGSLLKLLSK